MIEVPVYDKQGKEVDRLQINEAVLGGIVRPALLKQAIVMYHANQRQGTVGTKNRGLVAGSTKKLYKQKGTGNARAGTIRTPVRKGGGVAFAKQNRDFRQSMPQKQRQLARDSALLAKLKNQEAFVIDQLSFSAPKTKDFAVILKNLKIDRSCLVALENFDASLYKSLRNIPKVSALTVGQLNAGAICNHRKILFTKAALTAYLAAATGANKIA